MTYFPPPFTTISYAHAETHEGHFFNVSHVFNGVGAAGVAEVLLQTGSPDELHMAMGVDASAQIELELFEGTTFSAAGTALVIYDTNRVTANTSQSTATHTPTTTADGTQLRHVLMPGGGAILPAGGSDGSPVRGGTEWILAPSTVYLLRATNTSGGAIDIGLEMGFYEHA